MRCRGLPVNGTIYFLPQLSRVLHGWLLPAKPLPMWKTVGGAALLLAVIGACLALFLVLLPG